MQRFFYNTNILKFSFLLIFISFLYCFLIYLFFPSRLPILIKESDVIERASSYIFLLSSVVFFINLVKYKIFKIYNFIGMISSFVFFSDEIDFIRRYLSKLTGNNLNIPKFENIFYIFFENYIGILILSIVTLGFYALLITSNSFKLFKERHNRFNFINLYYGPQLIFISIFVSKILDSKVFFPNLDGSLFLFTVLLEETLELNSAIIFLYLGFYLLFFALKEENKKYY